LPALFSLLITLAENISEQLFSSEWLADEEDWH
jgi:hypothetical protein